MTNRIENTVDDVVEMKSKVFEKTPTLREIVEKSGRKNLFEYAQGYQQNHLSDKALMRRQELILAVSARVKQLFGEEAAQSVVSQLGKYFFVSTADHHGPVCHPFALNANLLTATQAHALENILVFSAGNVSLNNSSVPRGLIFHSDAGQYGQMQQVSFFPASENQRSVFGMQAYAKTDLDRLKKNLWLKVREGTLRMAVAEKVASIIDGVYGQADVLARANFSEQISVTNAKLWKNFFPSGYTAPRLIYLDQERVTMDILLSHHLSSSTIISEIILDKSLVPTIIKYFDGIRGGFSLAEKKGSYLFWALPANNKYRQQLWFVDGELRTVDGGFCVPLEADAIAEKLQNGELVPTMLLTFLVLSFYYGLKCLGGFLQPSYLTDMKTAYTRMLRELGLVSELEVFSSTDTKNMGGDLALAFLRDKNNKLHQATGLDLILYGNKDSMPILHDLSKHISVEESVTMMLPLFYDVLYRDSSRDNRLAAISTDEIIKLAGLDAKIKPCASM